MSERGMRTRAVLDRRFGVAVAALLVLAAVGGWVSYGAHVDPGVQTESRTTDEWRIEGDFSHRATVTAAAEGTPFEPGTVVRDRDLYFQRVMPVLSGTFRLSYLGGSEPVDVSVRQQLVIRGVDTSSETVYWEETRILGTDESTLAPGERIAVPFELNVSRTTARATAIDDRLEAPGTVRTRVRANVTVVKGETTRSVRFALPVGVDGGVYRPQAEPRAETFSRTETVMARNDPGTIRAYGGPIAFLVGLVGAGGLLVARRRGAISISAAERDWLDYRDDRADFDEWITTIRLPEEAASLPVAEAATLADLVDFAIDTDNAVLEAPDGDAYHVVHDSYRYTFEAPPEPDADAPLESDLADEASLEGLHGVEVLDGVDADTARALREAGVETLAELATADAHELADRTGLTVDDLTPLVERAGAELDDRLRE